jgi:hypothetical protein
MSFITNITSSPATTGSFTDGTPTAMDNDHGNIRAAGNISETGLFSSNSLGEGNPITLVSSGVHNKIAVNGGTWNFQDGSGVIVRATTSLGGVANNAALFGASDSSNGDSIHQSAVVRNRLYKTAVRAGYWNELTGTWSVTPTVANTGGWDIAAGADDSPTLKASKTDFAANPTSDAPGQWAQHQGVLAMPTTGNYKARYLW